MEKKVASRKERQNFEHVIIHDMKNIPNRQTATPVRGNTPYSDGGKAHRQIPMYEANLQEFPHELDPHIDMNFAKQTRPTYTCKISKRDLVWEEKRQKKLKPNLIKPKRIPGSYYDSQNKNRIENNQSRQDRSHPTSSYLANNPAPMTQQIPPKSTYSSSYGKTNNIPRGMDPSIRENIYSRTIESRNENGYTKTRHQNYEDLEQNFSRSLPSYGPDPKSYNKYPDMHQEMYRQTPSQRIGNDVRNNYSPSRKQLTEQRDLQQIPTGSTLDYKKAHPQQLPYSSQNNYKSRVVSPYEEPRSRGGYSSQSVPKVQSPYEYYRHPSQSQMYTFNHAKTPLQYARENNIPPSSGSNNYNHGMEAQYQKNANSGFGMTNEGRPMGDYRQIYSRTPNSVKVYEKPVATPYSYNPIINQGVMPYNSQMYGQQRNMSTPFSRNPGQGHYTPQVQTPYENQQYVTQMNNPQAYSRPPTNPYNEKINNANYNYRTNQPPSKPSSRQSSKPFSAMDFNGINPNNHLRPNGSFLAKDNQKFVYDRNRFPPR